MDETHDKAQEIGPTSTLLRVSSDKIGHLMDLVGELSLSVAETLQSSDLSGLDLPRFETASQRLRQIVREVQDVATELRLVPVDDVFKRLRRMVRELERTTGKSIELELIGTDTMVDKMVADRLYDPLLHVLRNAADHGLEPESERIAAGKAPRGRIILGARQHGSEVEITVRDDGRGLNRDRILELARKRGFFGPTDEPEPAKLWKVIFEPGFSTATTVTNLSGRGVGMDVLNTTLKDLRGSIGIDSVWGKGTTVSLHIPVSLAFLDCIILRHGAILYAVPIEDVVEILMPDPAALLRVSALNGLEALRNREDMIPVVRLDTFYGQPASVADAAQVLVVVQTRRRRIALRVCEVMDRQTVVMKPLRGALAGMRAGSGMALLGGGDVALVLDSERLSDEAVA